MRRRSLKGQKHDRDVAAVRSSYAKLFPICQSPWCRRLATDIHEIARGSHRQAALGERCCLLHLCRACHDEMDDYSVWPIARQLAMKLLGDPEGYDRVRVNLIRGRAAEAITQDEVDQYCVG